MIFSCGVSYPTPNYQDISVLISVDIVNIGIYRQEYRQYLGILRNMKWMFILQQSNVGRASTVSDIKNAKLKEKLGEKISPVGQMHVADPLIISHFALFRQSVVRQALTC